MKRKAQISLEEVLQGHMRDHLSNLMLSASLESQELNVYAKNGA